MLTATDAAKLAGSLSPFAIEVVGYVTLRIFGEPATIGEKFEVAFDVDQTDIAAFAAALGKLSRQFPVR